MPRSKLGPSILKKVKRLEKQVQELATTARGSVEAQEEHAKRPQRWRRRQYTGKLLFPEN
jgi:hypothetical protein